ncbi:ATP synthase subunit I [Thermoactinomyces mirandus]|uniref:ATP synthase subunit I n=1 Tax=Thermoactinomyces mirandus TaxID=2756294 RepID=A0A7W1XTJ3_9BACL|nr:ATP synthase subunit I [Thermoactinomyces mirandus]MBA4602955.1 ATP synthase subunit I [Thermoactinomyces mirandus]
MKKIQQQVVYFTAAMLALLLAIWFVAPYQRIVAGIFLGICVSLYNVFNLAKKMRVVEENVIATKTAKYRGIGMIHRYLMVALAIFFAVKFSAWFDVRAIVAGLPFCYILIAFLEFLDARRSPTWKERGESTANGKNT